MHRFSLTGEGLEREFQRLANAVMARLPRPAPAPDRLRSCRIVSHRGEHDNRGCIENTLAAFDAAAAAGVWGIELDVRWTRDLIPVVFHDPNTARLFEADMAIGQMTLAHLKSRFPLIPTLREVVERYGGRMHLMVEIKPEPYPNVAVQQRRMRAALRGMTPATQFHLMGLDPRMFDLFTFLPARAFIPIGRLRMDRVDRMAAARGWGGVAGHYLTTSSGSVKGHHHDGRCVGTGFVDSRRCLFRETARGIDWLFSNRAARMQSIRDRA